MALRASDQAEASTWGMSGPPLAPTATRASGDVATIHYGSDPNWFELTRGTLVVTDA
jgi:hypothetical protein